MNRGFLASLLAVGAACSGVVIAQQQPPVVMPVPPILQNYKPVTAERLLKPEDSDVLMVRRTYDGWGYSPLKQINTSNVSRLEPVWSFATADMRPRRWSTTA